MSCGHLSVKRDQATAEASPSPSSPASTALQTTSAAAETALQTTSAATETSSRSPQEMSIVARTHSGGKKKRRSLVGSNATKPAGVYDERLDSIEKANKDVWSVDVWDKDSDDDVEARKRRQTSECNWLVIFLIAMSLSVDCGYILLPISRLLEIQLNVDSVIINCRSFRVLYLS